MRDWRFILPHRRKLSFAATQVSKQVSKLSFSLAESDCHEYVNPDTRREFTMEKIL